MTPRHRNARWDDDAKAAIAMGLRLGRRRRVLLDLLEENAFRILYFYQATDSISKKEICELTDVPRTTMRHWTREGVVPKRGTIQPHYAHSQRIAP